MIIDAVEYHEAALPDGVGWEGAAALLAAICVWAKAYGHFDLAGAETLQVSQIEAIGDPSIPPSEWVSSELDFEVNDTLFAATAANFLREFVGVGKYHSMVSGYLQSGQPYGLPDDWPALRPVADLIEQEFVARSWR